MPLLSVVNPDSGLDFTHDDDEGHRRYLHSTHSKKSSGKKE